MRRSNVTARAAVTAVRTAARFERLTTEAHATWSAMSGKNSNGDFIDKTHKNKSARTKW